MNLPWHWPFPPPPKEVQPVLLPLNEGQEVEVSVEDGKIKKGKVLKQNIDGTYQVDLGEEDALTFPREKLK